MLRWKDRLELGEGKKHVFWRQENRGSGKTEIEGRSVVWRNGSIELGEAEERERERWKKISGSKYNRWYKVKVKGERIPEYLKKGWGASRRRRMTRFRLSNKMRKGRYWESEKRRRCRLCGGEVQTWEHVWERCKGDWERELGRKW